MDEITVNITEVVEDISINVTEAGTVVITVTEGLTKADIYTGLDHISVGLVPPSNPQIGDLWVDTN